MKRLKPGTQLTLIMCMLAQVVRVLTHGGETACNDRFDRAKERSALSLSRHSSSFTFSGEMREKAKCENLNFFRSSQSFIHVILTCEIHDDDVERWQVISEKSVSTKLEMKLLYMLLTFTFIQLVH